MSSDSRDGLATMPPAEIVISRWVALDWLDGPREGFIELSHPPGSWYFRTLADRVGTNEPDDLLFTFSRLPAGSIDTARQILADLRPPASDRNWIPRWVFATPAEQQDAEQRIDALVRTAGAPEFIVRSVILDGIDAAWRIVRSPGPTTA
jgi:hypothetical protein